MLGNSILFLLTLAATGLTQEPPEGYRTVYITSNVDPTFVIVAKEATAGTTTIVYVINLNFLKAGIDGCIQVTGYRN